MNRKGFAIFELVIVVMIIGMLAAIAIPKIHDMIAGHHEKKVGYAIQH